MAMQSLLARFSHEMANLDATKREVVPDAAMHQILGKMLDLYFHQMLADIYIPLTVASVDRLRKDLMSGNSHLTWGDMWDKVDEITTRLYDEIENHGKFFYIPIDRANYFDTLEPFGRIVSQKFPKLTEDIQEAAKCYACGRYTACVFHLMRIMEHGVQRFGKKLGVKQVELLVWQVILDQTNKAISALPAKSSQTKKFAAIAGHLYNVKLAWRNEVMHPKATYTEEEAEHLLSQIKFFMQHLSKCV